MPETQDCRVIERKLVTQLVSKALTDISALPSSLRADFYEGAALALEGHAPDLAKECRETASHMRDAEARQLYLAEVLKEFAHEYGD